MDIKIEKEVQNIVDDIFSKIGIQAKSVWENSSVPRLSVESENDISFLVGRDGATLNAIEHLVRLITIRRTGGQCDFSLDIGNFRKAQNERIISLARQRAEYVANSNQAESLPPMNSYERKLVHTELASFTDVTTQSIGTDPHRRIVIKPALKI